MCFGKRLQKEKYLWYLCPCLQKDVQILAIIATLTARTLFLDLTIAVCWIKPLLSAMVASKKNPCRLDKAYYRSSTAHRQYKTILVESRAGINISPADLVALDELVTPLILQGQSPYMILRNHPEIALSEKTLYNYIESGALSVKNIDLPKR